MIKAYFNSNPRRGRMWAANDLWNLQPAERAIISGSEAIRLDAAIQDELSDSMLLRGPGGMYCNKLTGKMALSLARIARGEA